MFSYNFTDNSTSPWINDFDKWRGLAFPDPSTVQSHVSLCHRFRQALTNALVNIMPEARGNTHVTVFTARPLRLGVPNTLICAISDVYPPALNITWKKGGQILTTALDSYKYVAMEDLTFQAFSYLNVTAYHNDFFSCEVQVAGDDRTIVAYWIPQYPVPSELLLYGLCGSGFTLGIIFLLLGVWFCYFARKLHNTD
ncbi:class II histocompatibility antigen, M alpha chain-like isoform X2 [Eleutherodactylus coqui]